MKFVNEVKSRLSGKATKANIVNITSGIVSLCYVIDGMFKETNKQKQQKKSKNKKKRSIVSL